MAIKSAKRAIILTFVLLTVLVDRVTGVETPNNAVEESTPSVDSTTLADLELEQLRLKRNLLHEKLMILEERRREVVRNEDLPFEGIKSLVNATQTNFFQ